jgi:pyruvate dehydrogenase E1 component alpha subunit
MREIRIFEERVNELFAAGEIHGTTHLCQGQEALAVALACELQPTDVVAATYRGHGIALALGMTVEAVLGEIMGRKIGCTGGVGGSMHLSSIDVGVLPTSAIVGGGLPIAAGAALAFQVRQEDRVAVAVFGDGASNIGAFHESLNLAAVWKLPVIFICDNNVYGEYSRIDLTTAVEDIHLRAASYAIPGVVVDGMNIDETRSAIREAVSRARSGEGPTLIEAKTYRFAGHSRADTAPYRPDGELDEWKLRDPLDLMAAALIADDVATQEEITAIDEEVARSIDRSLETVRASEEPSIHDMFSHVWAGAQSR